MSKKRKSNEPHKLLDLEDIPFVDPKVRDFCCVDSSSEDNQNNNDDDDDDDSVSSDDPSSDDDECSSFNPCSKNLAKRSQRKKKSKTKVDLKRHHSEPIVNCPACSRAVPTVLLELHLDSDCLSTPHQSNAVGLNRTTFDNGTFEITSKDTTTIGVGSSRSSDANSQKTHLDLTTCLSPMTKRHQTLLSPVRLVLPAMPLMSNTSAKKTRRILDFTDDEPESPLPSVTAVLMSAKSRKTNRSRVSMKDKEKDKHIPNKGDDYAKEAVNEIEESKGNLFNDDSENGSDVNLECDDSSKKDTSSKQQWKKATTKRMSELVCCPICQSAMVDWRVGIHIDSGECYKKKSRMSIKGQPSTNYGISHLNAEENGHHHFGSEEWIGRTMSGRTPQTLAHLKRTLSQSQSTDDHSHSDAKEYTYKAVKIADLTLDDEDGDDEHQSEVRNSEESMSESKANSASVEAQTACEVTVSSVSSSTDSNSSDGD